MARKKGIALDGVLLLDKPVGWSSNQCLGAVKRLLNAQKAGHTGTLDPFATGLLPVCLGEATKFSSGLLDADKAYEAEAYLGERTQTGDIEGEVIERRAVDVNEDQIRTAMHALTGVVTQVPPMYSALKHEGKPLYELARAGIEVERKPRQVTVFSFELLALEAPMLRFRVRCSKGTYVRTLAEQLGEALGCGAHLRSLRRIGIAEFGADAAVSVNALEAASMDQRLAHLLPIDLLVREYTKVDLDASLASRFLQGQRLALSGPTGLVRVYDPGARFLGTALSDGYVLAPQRVVSSH